jgi:uncharacterized delta-60 repeat protein
MKRLCFCGAFLFLTAGAYGDYQSLDRTFGTDGIVITNLGTNSGTLNREVPTLHVTVQPDGKILLIGDTYNHDNFSDSNTIRSHITLVRYMPDGSLDMSFGKHGCVIIPYDGIGQCATDFALQNDGKMVIAGRTWDTSSMLPAATIIRLHPDGSLDSSFGNSGMIIEANMSQQWSNFFNVRIQDDGSIVAAGSYGVDMPQGDDVLNCCLYLKRYLRNGNTDMSFGQHGTVKTFIEVSNRPKQRPLSRAGDALFGLAVDRDNKMVGVGKSLDYSAVSDDLALSTLGVSSCDSGIVRFNADGSLDSSFGSDHNGMVVTSVSRLCNFFVDVAITSEDKIIALGTAQHEQTLRGQYSLVRYLSDGSLDTTFGTDGTGIVRTALGVGHAAAKNIIEQADGKLLVTGVVEWENGKRFTIVRYTPDGAIDTTFGSDSTGVITLSVRGTRHSDEQSFSLALQRDGKLLVAGDSAQSGQRDFALARYKP